MEEFKPYGTTDIRDFIEKGKSLSVSESKIAYKALIEHSNGSVALKYHNIITKYYNVLKTYIVDMTLKDDDLQKYKYQPNLLSYDLYDTPELGYSILYINNMVSLCDFNKSKIKVFTTNFPEILEELMTLTKEDLQLNRHNNNLQD